MLVDQPNNDMLLCFFLFCNSFLYCIVYYYAYINDIFCISKIYISRIFYSIFQLFLQYQNPGFRTIFLLRDVNLYDLSFNFVKFHPQRSVDIRFVMTDVGLMTQNLI